MNIYKILKIYQKIKSPKVKLLGILALHITKRRYLSLNIDPALACNFRCRMCYFSDNEAARKNKKFKLQRKINTKWQKKIKKNYLLAKAN